MVFAVWRLTFAVADTRRRRARTGATCAARDALGPVAAHGISIATESLGRAPRACTAARAGEATEIPGHSSGGAPRACAGSSDGAGHGAHDRGATRRALSSIAMHPNIRCT